MAAPFIFIGTYTIREGKLEDFKQYCREFSASIEATEPRLIYFGLCLNEAGTELTVVQVHPDPASMEFHLQVAREHFVQAYEYLETTESQQLYGSLSDVLVERIKQVSEPGVPMIIKSELTGFSRLPAVTV